MLVTVARYQVITGDTTSATAEVEQALTDAQRLLEDDLGRQLETATRTERCAVCTDPESGQTVAFPTVTPITSVTNPSGAEVVFDIVYGVTPASVPLSTVSTMVRPLYADITYVGGLDPAQTDPAALDYVPGFIERDLAWVAWQLLRPGRVAQVPAGAARVRTGDASVTFARPQSPSTAGIDWSPATLQWTVRRP